MAKLPAAFAKNAKDKKKHHAANKKVAAGHAKHKAKGNPFAKKSEY